MATETATSHPTPTPTPTPDESVESKAIEEVKFEEEIAALGKKVEEEEKAKAEEMSSAETPLPKPGGEAEEIQKESDGVEVKMEHQPSAVTVAVEEKKDPIPDSNALTTPDQVAAAVDVVDSQAVVETATELPPQITDQKPHEPSETIPPAQESAVAVEKETEDISALSKDVTVVPETEVTLADQSQVSKMDEKPEPVVLPETEVKLEVSESIKQVEEPQALVVQDEAKLEDQTEATKTESIVADVDEKLEEQTEVTKPDEKPEAVEAIENPEAQPEVLPIKDSEAAVVKDIENSEAMLAKVDKPELVVSEVEKNEPVKPDVEVKPEGLTEVTGEVENIKCDGKESVEDEKVKDEATGTDKVAEDHTIIKEETIVKQEEESASSEQVSTNQKVQADLKGEGDEDESSVCDVTEKAFMKGESQESEVTDEMASKEVGVVVVEEESEDVEEKREAKVIKTEGEGKEREVVNNEELAQQPTQVEDVNKAEVTEKLLEGNDTTAEAVAEKDNEENIDEKKTPALVETSIVDEGEGKIDDTTTTAGETDNVAQDSELQVKGGGEGTETTENKLEKENVEDVAESDVGNLEISTKDGSDDAKPVEEQPREVPAKPTQKQSSNILTKVKQSLVKAKKAIIGKSPNPKTISSDTKGDIKAK